MSKAAYEHFMYSKDSARRNFFADRESGKLLANVGREPSVKDDVNNAAMRTGIKFDTGSIAFAGGRFHVQSHAKVTVRRSHSL